MIKAIETHYKGCRFRSRLEARWAVFFDFLGVHWEYEKEGYSLGDGLLYLPDFWLPQVDMWAEVKPTEFTRHERNKTRLLARGTGFPCLLLVGVPHHRTVVSDEVADGDDDPHTCGYALTNYHGYVTDEGRFYSCPENEDGFPDTLRAEEAARSARFEFKKTVPALSRKEYFRQLAERYEQLGSKK